MSQNPENFRVESTPVLDLKKSGLKNHSEPGIGPAPSWDADRTEVYADLDESDAIATLSTDAGESCPITTFPFVIGRGTECDLVLQGKGVSRKHAEIVFQSGRFVVNDLESLNGIKVNGYKVARVILEENDNIKLGEVALTFHSGEKGAADSAPEPEKKSLFAKRAKGTPAPADDTFGPNPWKKMVSALALIMAVGLLAYAGFMYLQRSSQPPLAGFNQDRVAPAPSGTSAGVPAGDIAPSQPASAATTPAPTAATRQSSTEAPPAASAIDPPPSLALAPVRQGNTDNTVSRPPEPVAAAPEPKAPPAPKPKPKPNLNSQAAAARSTAQSLYIQGKAPAALQELKQYIGNAAVSKSYQDQVSETYRDIDALYSQYTSGQRAFAAGDKDQAFSLWTAFMAREAKVLDGQKSSYSRSITTKVMDEYVERGNQASNQGDYHRAYNYWNKAIELGDSVTAKIALDNLNNKARQLYRQALRLEYVNTSKAKAMWAEVTTLLPPGTEYHTKASAKLAWYEKWGS
ncbi:MAG: FHA domain-containing protein [Pseudomonadota bacterium]|nr:FHA domain-containing protein [Pseudomonadota bacterium]